MLRHVRRESPSSWRAAHDRLADFFGGLRDATGLTGREGWRDAGWAGYAKEEAYHQLCASRPDALVHALHGAVDTYYWSTLAAARSWTEMIVQAGRDAALPLVTERGEALLDHAGTTTDNKLAFLTALADDTTLDAMHRARAFADRGSLHEDESRYAEAIRDLTQAVELDPSSTWAIAIRGWTYRSAGRYEEALTDLNRAIELDPSDAWTIAIRGWIYGSAGRYEEALTDLNRAIELDPADTSILAYRGDTYRLAGRYDEAIADLNRAIELDPADGWSRYCLGLLHLALGETSEAHENLNRALSADRVNIESSPYDVRVWFNVAVYLLALDKEDEAVVQIRATLSQGASPAAVRDVIDDLEELRRVTGRSIADVVAILTDFAGD
jgi:tetratricopeptide (TPR) repeat protein